MHTKCYDKVNYLYHTVRKRRNTAGQDGVLHTRENTDIHIFGLQGRFQLLVFLESFFELRLHNVEFFLSTQRARLGVTSRIAWNRNKTLATIDLGLMGPLNNLWTISTPELTIAYQPWSQKLVALFSWPSNCISPGRSGSDIYTNLNALFFSLWSLSNCVLVCHQRTHTHATTSKSSCFALNDSCKLRSMPANLCWSSLCSSPSWSPSSLYALRINPAIHSWQGTYGQRHQRHWSSLVFHCPRKWTSPAEDKAWRVQNTLLTLMQLDTGYVFLPATSCKNNDAGLHCKYLAHVSWRTSISLNTHSYTWFWSWCSILDLESWCNQTG